MFCVKCGSVLTEGFGFCSKCGAPVPNTRPDQTAGDDGTGTAEQVLEVQIKKCLLYLILGAAVAAAIVLVINFSHSYRKPVKKYMAAVETFDMEENLACYPDFVVDAIMEDYGYPDREAMLTDFQYVADYERSWLCLDCDSFEINCRIEDVETVKKDNVAVITWGMEKKYGISDSDIPNIKKAKAVQVDMEETGVYNGIVTDNTETYTVYVGKIHSKWYVLQSDKSDIF